MSNRIKKERRLANLNTESQVPELSIWASFRKSPFPPPDELEKYEGLYPGITKLFLIILQIKQTTEWDLKKL